ncbi:DNAj domain containing protein [Theileria equi strain WA]|uniref:DNAj domain containing protein n=1 Tax=Theileria equi strain WA TaxID=1537102 RepID=L0AWL8_THEEQ|nr:DNAj domain containing protein [Theileria equi strain WA]AFZ79653.1 DNAj domain containing protein [Theileria equi strain WA]|eukprot:XP_004829319.1 DNAj domain containing protein [Theileria equi strain WA]
MEEREKHSSLSGNVADYLNKRNNFLKKSELTYYEVLEVEKDCTPEDIRHAFYHFARIFHPDKSGNSKYSWVFNEIKNAYDVLSNEYKRSSYDFENGFINSEDIQEKLTSIGDAMKQLYYTFINEKADAYINSVYHEFTHKGLVIKRALFGDLSLVDPNLLSSTETINVKRLQGPYIDVTVQLQVLIQNGVLHLNSGNFSSFAYLPGFYNPLHFDQHRQDSEAQLYVLYLFNDNVHEVTVSDKNPISLPMKSHMVYGAYIKGPYPLANLDRLEFCSVCIA